MIHQSSHPLVKSLVNRLRDLRIDAQTFRHIVGDVTHMMLYETLSRTQTITKEIPTWQENARYDFIDEANMVFVTILRAGLPMLESANALFPYAKSGFLAMRRDEESKKSILYYDRVPECEGKTVIILDVMVATGGSLCDAIDLLKKKNPAKLISVNILAAPEGIQAVDTKHSDVDFYIAQIDHALNDDKFILPGLGDAGDRSYNTL